MYYNHGISLHGLSKRTALDVKQESIIVNTNIKKFLKGKLGLIYKDIL